LNNNHKIDNDEFDDIKELIGDDQENLFAFLFSQRLVKW